MQVEWKWCGGLNIDNLKDKLYTTHNLWEEAPLPSLIVYSVPLHGDYIQMSLFPWTCKWESQIKTIVVSKLRLFVFFSNQVCCENVKAISYSLQKDHSNDV
jgi:hypothetical protein